MRRRLFYTDHHHFPLPPGHKFPLRKYRLLREQLERSRRFTFEPAPLAEPRSIARIHEQSYVDGFLAGALDAGVMRRIGFPWSEALVRRTLASVGGTLAAAEEALESGWCGALAGGTHHAFRSEGAGYCVFNDIAVAIAHVRAAHTIERAAVVDLDVHQGDGTAAIFERDSSVLTVSVHSRNNFPFRKQRSTIDVELSDGTGDLEYLAAVNRVLPEVARFGPQIVFYQSGVDALAADRLGRLSLTESGLAERDRCVFELCRKLGVPVVVTLGGGYSEPIELTVGAHAQTFLLAAELLDCAIAPAAHD